MSSFFALIVTVCALTGECSDIMLGVYQTESGCDAAAKEQHVKGVCYPYKPAETNSLLSSFNRVMTNGCYQPLAQNPRKAG
jgi:hypothetical protein